MDELLSIKDLTVKFYTYEGVVHALDNVNLNINREETFGLVGETGSGKTLTALSILRLIPPSGRIESGSIYLHVDGNSEPINLLELDEEEMRELRGGRISMVFQEPSSALNPVYTIGDQISEVILLHRQRELARKALSSVTEQMETGRGLFNLAAKPVRLLESSIFGRASQNPNSLLLRVIRRIPLVRRLLRRLSHEANQMAIDALKEVEIPDPHRITQRYPHELSGGMKQRAVIAMALACSPRFLIADEPTTSLDVTIQAQILELLRRLKEEGKSSVLYITHDLAVAAELCDRVGVMYAGSLCEVSPVDDLYANPLHPYTIALLAAVPKPGQEPQAIGGTVPDPMNMPPGCRFHPRCPHAMPVCQEQAPTMRQQGPGHFVACHLHQGENGGNSS